ncbi:MAG TPA: hypothetical protein V6D27_12130 [Vampirovibrionales bacterium]
MAVVIGDRHFTAIATQMLPRSPENFLKKSPFARIKGDRLSFITDSNPIPPITTRSFFSFPIHRPPPKTPMAAYNRPPLNHR